MPVYAYVVLAVGWLAWMLPFLLMKRNKAKAQQIDRRALGHFSGVHCVLHRMAAHLLGDIGTNLAIRAFDNPFHPGKCPYLDRGPHSGTTVAA